MMGKIKKLTLKRLAEKIAADNEKFTKATKAEKRVIIAQDCLERINIKQILPESGTFLDENVICDLVNNGETSFQNILNNPKFNSGCMACAKGGLFMSFVGRTNKVNVVQISCTNDENDFDHKKLLKLFSLKQLTLIEAAFEGRQCIGTDTVDLTEYSDKDYSYSFTKYLTAYPNDKKRLIAICNNIIENKGEFIY